MAESIAKRIANMVADARGTASMMGRSYLRASIGNHMVEVGVLYDGASLAIDADVRSVGVMDTREKLVAWIAAWLKEKEA